MFKVNTTDHLLLLLKDTLTTNKVEKLKQSKSIKPIKCCS